MLSPRLPKPSLRAAGPRTSTLITALIAVLVCALPLTAIAESAPTSDVVDTATPLTDDGRPAQGAVAPEPITLVEAAYPGNAFANAIEATVGLMLYIDRAGAVVKIDVVEPAAEHGLGFDEAAVAALSASTFKPALMDGEPVPVKIRYTYAFTLTFVDPVLHALVEAPYPPTALRDGITDAVVAHIDVDDTGAVTGVSIVEPAANPGMGFDVAAATAMAAFRYDPATRNDVPVAATIVYRYEFVLPERWVPLTERPINLALTLRERGTREPIPSGMVSLQRGDEEPIEEAFEKGHFDAKGLEAGTWSVLVDADGYDIVETEEVIVDGEKLEATYYIERRFYDVYDASGEHQETGQYVYETREKKVKKEVAVTTLDVAEIQRIPGVQGDALKVVQNLPGVARAPSLGRSAGAIIVRGSAPEDTIVLLDGAPIPILYHFGGLRAVINSDTLAAINFLPGNFSVRYGRATGGVLDVQTRAPNKEHFKGHVDLNLIDGGLLLEGPITDNLSFQVSARRSWLDAVILAVVDEDDLSFTTAPRYYDTQARLHWASESHHLGKPSHEVEAAYYGSDDTLELLREDDNETMSFYMNTGFERGLAKWNSRGDWGENKLVYGLGYDNTTVSLGDINVDNADVSNTLRDELTLHPTATITLTMGVDSEVTNYSVDVVLPASHASGDDSDGDGRGPGRDDEEETLSQETTGVAVRAATFLEAAFTPREEVRMALGARTDYDGVTDSVSFDLRSTARFQLDPQFAVKGGVGTFHQPPLFQELDEVFGNPDLSYESAVHYALGFEASLPDYEALTLDVTGFYKQRDDLIARSTAFVERDGELVAERYANTGDGTVIGAEVMLRHALTNNLFGWLSYTLSKSTERDSLDEEEHPFEYDQTHILTLLASYKLPSNWQVGFRFRYVTGNPYTELTRGVFDTDTGRYESVTGAINEARIAPFHQLDVRVDKDWIFDTWILTAYLDVQNVYYHANPESVRYNFDYSEVATVNGLPILPSFGLRGAF